MLRRTIRLGTAAAVAVTTMVALAPPNASAAPEGAATLSVSSGTGSTNFNLGLPSGASCSGTGAQGYRWETFIASASIDVGTLLFNDGPNQPVGTFTDSLWDPNNSEEVKQKFPGLGGFISGIPQLNFSNLVGSGITNGAYKVGVFCADLNVSQRLPSTTQAGSGSQNEIQRITPAGIASTGGTFTITWNGQTTAAIAHDASAATIDAALEALSNIGAGNVSVTGGPVNSAFVAIEFTGALALADRPQVTTSAVNLAPVSGRLDNGHYWEKLITVTNAATMAWTAGAVPPALTLGAATAGNAQCAFSTGFTTTVADPAATYAVTTVPATVSTTVTPGTAFTLSSLDNGTAYAVTVTATNTVGSTTSNTVSCTPTFGIPAAPSPFTATSGTNQVVLAWTPAAVPAGATLVNHVITVTPPATAGSSFTVLAGTNTLTVAAAPGSYAFTIQATYNPGGFLGAVGSVNGTSNSSQTIIQDITVVRPVGALVLTQRCGVYGALLAEPASDGFPLLPAVGDSDGSSYPFAGNTPGSAPTTGTLPGGPADSANFPEYPYPVDANGLANPEYPTHCGINLGIGQLVTSGSYAGQYFRADGRLNQVTVVDTRDTDPGWTVNGTMSNFTNTVSGGGLRSFSGNYLGWTPKVTDDSDLSMSGYNQLVTAGPSVAPSLSTGLTTGSALASAPATDGLGIATLDARLRLLIPIEVVNGTYTATLTFTTI